jgi:hypothetical protein
MAIVVLVVSISGSMNVNPLDQFTLIIGQGGGIQIPTGGGMSGSIAPTYAPPQTYTGQLNIQVNHRDSLDGSEDRTEGTEIITTYYKKVAEGNYVTLGSGDNIMLFVSEDEKLYFTVQALQGSELYISPIRMSDYNLNPRIIDFDYLDVTHDGIGEWMFTVDITGLPTMYPQTNPTISLFSLSYDEGSMLLNSPSDFKVYHENSINNIRWEIEIPPEKAVAINKVELIFDTTDSSVINEKSSWVKIPYISCCELTQMDKTITTNTIIYSFEIGSDLANADYISTESNADPSHDMTVRIHTYLEEGDELGVTLRIRAITTDQTFYSVSDKVTLIATSEENIPSRQEILDLTQEMALEQLEEIIWTPTLECEEGQCYINSTVTTKWQISRNNTE